MRIGGADAVPEAYCRQHFPQRYEKALRFRAADDRRRSICAGVLMNEVLALKECDIRCSEYGKPYSDAGSCFSLSHSGEYTVLAVSPADVGVDVESTQEDPHDLLPYVLSDE